ncbi:hypothetical protein GL307_30975 [Nocardia seriolae]|nr:hypothetical protein [Nocardia seriolae]
MVEDRAGGEPERDSESGHGSEPENGGDSENGETAGSDVAAPNPSGWGRVWAFADRVERAVKASYPGLVVAWIFFLWAVSPSLLPRTWLFEGLVCGISAAIGYGGGVRAGVGVQEVGAAAVARGGARAGATVASDRGGAGELEGRDRGGDDRGGGAGAGAVGALAAGSRSADGDAADHHPEFSARGTARGGHAGAGGDRVPWGAMADPVDRAAAEHRMADSPQCRLRRRDRTGDGAGGAAVPGRAGESLLLRGELGLRSAQRPDLGVRAAAAAARKVGQPTVIGAVEHAGLGRTLVRGQRPRRRAHRAGDGKAGARTDPGVRGAGLGEDAGGDRRSHCEGTGSDPRLRAQGAGRGHHHRHRLGGLDHRRVHRVHVRR